MEIFVGNLPCRMSAKQVEQLFARHGMVQSVRLIVEAESGRSRGFGFITMADSMQAGRVVSVLNGHEIQGRPIAVAAISGCALPG